MKDKELLEFAAKAVGIKGKYTNAFSGDYYDCRNLSRGVETEHGELWNPLDYGDDALGLAVDLDIPIIPESCNGTIWIRKGDLQLFEPIGSDKQAATRRAIVRAAAHMGAEL